MHFDFVLLGFICLRENCGLKGNVCPFERKYDSSPLLIFTSSCVEIQYFVWSNRSVSSAAYSVPYNIGA